MMRWIAILSLVALAACGADGEPETFGNVGVSIGPGGITPTATVGASDGPFSVRVGF